jgi:hypothetical protein
MAYRSWLVGNRDSIRFHDEKFDAPSDVTGRFSAAQLRESRILHGLLTLKPLSGPSAFATGAALSAATTDR